MWALEVVLHLCEDPGEIWTAERLTQSLRANLAMIEDILRRLEAIGLVRREDGGLLYRPASPELADLVARTRIAYRHKPFAMISLIGRGASVLQELADAFRLKEGN